MPGTLFHKAKKLLNGMALGAALVLCFSAQGHAACSNPAGIEGQILYNSTQKLSQYCDDTNWIRMNPMPGSGSGGCTNPAANEGDIIYSEDNYVMQVCAGNVWQAMGPPGGNSKGDWKQVNGGRGAFCGIRSDNSLWCWGSGYLGDGNGNTFSQFPVRVNDGGAQWKTVSPGAAICGIQMDDSLWCWGDDTFGTVGDGATTGPQLTPVKIGTASWKHISAKIYTTCGIQSDDSLWCWGGDLRGQVGDGSPAAHQTAPVKIGTDTWKKISAADSSTAASCGIKSDDSLWCWGYSQNGEMGNGASGTTIYYDPVAIAVGQTWKDITVGSSSSCGLKTDNTLWCWGSDGNGQLANGGATGIRTTPSAAGDGGAWNTIKFSYLYHGCGLHTDDTLWCWGWNAWGMTGIGTETGSATSPTQVSGGGTWLDFAVTQTASCGIKSGGKLSCWGAGFTPYVNTYMPTPVAGGHKWQKIATGGYYYDGWDEHACGIRTDGVMMCWGGNDDGQLGNNYAQTVAYAPFTVSGGYTWSDVSAGDKSVCGVRTNGVAMCWGLGVIGQLGNGTNTAAQPTPVTVSGGHTWQQIGGEAHEYCGIRTDGVAMCWGLGTSGQLGNGASASSNVPVTVSGGYTWQMVSAAGSHACGIRTDGVAMCWGDNANYQLGTGNTTPSNVPVMVSGGHTWKYISAGYSATCGVRTDGVQMCWGYDENWNTLTVPTMVSGTDTWLMALSGVSDPDTRCGIKSDGKAMCIGYYVGDGDPDAGNGYFGSYVEVAGGGTWKHLDHGDMFACGVTTDGNGYCWGEDWIGQIGYGGGAPVLIPSEAAVGCTGPDGNAGDLLYNTDYNVMQFCNGANWYAIGK